MIRRVTVTLILISYGLLSLPVLSVGFLYAWVVTAFRAGRENQDDFRRWLRRSE